MRQSAVIEDIDSYLPEREIANSYFASRLDTSDEWIKSRTGISTRYWAEPNVCTSDLAVNAGARLLARAKMPEQIDLLILCTTTPDHPCPATAPDVAYRLGLHGIPAFDISAVCSGFVYALSVATGYIVSGLFQRVLVIAAETYSTILDPADRTASVIFGDGAGAVLLRCGSPSEQGSIAGFNLGSDGRYKSSIIIRGGGSRSRSSSESSVPGDEYFHMEGREVFDLAVRRMTESVRAVLTAVAWNSDDVNWFVAHQANERILRTVANALGVRASSVVMNLDKVGNTSAASIPLALCDARRRGRLKCGDKVVLAAFGGGVTWGATALTWPAI